MFQKVRLVPTKSETLASVQVPNGFFGNGLVHRIPNRIRRVVSARRLPRHPVPARLAPYMLRKGMLHTH